MKRLAIVCLMGPTAAGKTPLAVELVQRFPCDIISVDSAMIYRGMDIGTAKPDADTLQLAPHRLIDIRDPSETYSAGQFRQDALQQIANIHEQGRLPLLVGGTMMYFRVLQQGLAALPSADAAVRAALQERADQRGWEVLHAELALVDPVAAQRIHVRDSQRIQRALEVYLLTGRTMTDWQTKDTNPLAQYEVLNLILAPNDRATLHDLIAKRFKQMMADGFMQEVAKLYERGDLNENLPSIRSVGYREAWQHLSGEIDLATMQEKAIAATRQLAKRQLTWLRSWQNASWIERERPDVLDIASQQIAMLIKGK